MSNGLAFARTLSFGDIAVHLDHGLGRVERLEEDAGREYVVMAFRDDKRLFVPADDLDRVWRYSGPNGTATLDRLSGAGWAKRVRGAADEVAKAALLLTERRKARAETVGPPVSYDKDVDAEIAAGFPHELTPDQAAALDDVWSDLEDGPPMDRLVCGDVGFGKTEIAIRAAVMVAKARLQVVVIAPTTVLAHQHATEFTARLKPLGLRVGHLSRFVKNGEAEAVRTGVAKGEIDVLVGTHAVLSDEVTFKALGLVVIDEEQRFGADAKQSLQSRWPDVHRLALSATPIPQTLRTALVGLRELSLLRHPPAVRKPITTKVGPWNDVAIANALREEKEREGQAFLICPRVADMDAMRATLDSLVPGLNVITAHGQLAPETLEERMTRFANGEADVLLATNIVESGLNITRANTIIIHRANLFGLAQLHQLRGRVGRSDVAATAIFTHPVDEDLTEDAANRFAALEALQDRGAGFDLSLEDLELRGAGDLDEEGAEQTGHVGVLGLNLFGRLLDLSLAGVDIRADNALASPQIDLGLTPHIPRDVVPDDGERLALYCALARALSEADIDAAEAKLREAGDVPVEVERLLSRARLRLACRGLGVADLKAGPKGLVIALADRPDTKTGKRLARDVAAGLKRGIKGRIGVGWKKALIVKAKVKAPETRLALAQRLVGSLASWTA